jgi:hypothetical protein
MLPVNGESPVFSTCMIAGLFGFFESFIYLDLLGFG